MQLFCRECFTNILLQLFNIYLIQMRLYVPLVPRQCLLCNGLTICEPRIETYWYQTPQDKPPWVRHCA